MWIVGKKPETEKEWEILQFRILQGLVNAWFEPVEHVDLGHIWYPGDEHPTLVSRQEYTTSPMLSREESKNAVQEKD